MEKRRDEAFSALVDLLAERRRVLSEMQDTAELMGMHYVASRADEQERRAQTHEVVENSLKVWSSKVPVRVADAEEQGFRLKQMLKELELKQRQLFKLLSARDQSEAAKQKLENKDVLDGDLNESRELLNLFLRECKEDTRELKDQYTEAALELEAAERDLRDNQLKLRGLVRQQQECEGLLRVVQRGTVEQPEQEEQRLEDRIEELRGDRDAEIRRRRGIKKDKVLVEVLDKAFQKAGKLARCVTWLAPNVIKLAEVDGLIKLGLESCTLLRPQGKPETTTLDELLK